MDHPKQHQVFEEQQLCDLLLLIVFNSNLVGFLNFYLFLALFCFVFCLFFALSLLLLYTNVRLVDSMETSDIHIRFPNRKSLDIWSSLILICQPYTLLMHSLLASFITFLIWGNNLRDGLFIILFQFFLFWNIFL